MIKKIIKFLEKRRKKSRFQNNSSVSSFSKKSNILPFIKTLNRKKNIETEETEQKRIDKVAIDLTDNFNSIARNPF